MTFMFSLIGTKRPSLPKDISTLRPLYTQDSKPPFVEFKVQISLYPSLHRAINMFYRYGLLAAAALGVTAIPAPIPQGITAAIAPSASAPAGCSINFSGTFGIAVMAASGGSAPASQIPEYVGKAVLCTEMTNIGQWSTTSSFSSCHSNH
jgi:hypothetical protein